MNFTIVVDSNVFTDERGVQVFTEHLDKDGFPYEVQKRIEYRLVATERLRAIKDNLRDYAN